MAGGTTNQQVGGSNYGAPVVGSRTVAAIQSGRKTPQFLGPVQINKMIAPVYQLARKGGISKTTEQPAFFWDEEDGLPITVTTTASEIAAGDTTVNLASGQGTRVVPGMNLWCERTGEILHIKSISTDALTVTRAVTTTPAAAIIATGGVAEELRIMASNFGEGSLAPSGLSVEPPLITNYTQTMRRAYEGSRRLIDSQNYGTPEWQRMDRDCQDAFQRDMEFAFLFMPGSKSTDADAITGAGGTVSQGIEAFITDNNFNVGGIAQEADMFNWLLVWTRMNANDKSNLMLVGGDGLMRLINDVARDNIRYSTDDKFLGMEVQEYQSPVGKMKFMQHPAFTPQYGSVTAANSGLVGQAMGLNYKNIGICTYKNGKMRRETEIQAIGTDGKKVGIIADQGWICQNQRTHINVYGIQN